MKKKLLIQAALFLCAISAYGQVGINTENPQGTFHIDGGKDNPTSGAPDATQQKNDFVVTSAGKVGIRTAIPNSSLDINGSVSNTIRYVTTDAPVVVDENDHTIVIYESSGIAKIRLPKAATCLGRTYTIINNTLNRVYYNVGIDGFMVYSTGGGNYNLDHFIDAQSTDLIVATKYPISTNPPTTPTLSSLVPVWWKISNTTFYNSDGNITNAREVGLGSNNSLKFTSPSHTDVTNESRALLFLKSRSISSESTEKDMIGIGKETPQEKLDVNGAVKIGNRSTYTGVAHGATTPVPDGGAGTIIFDGTGFFGWNGTSWRKLDN